MQKVAGIAGSERHLLALLPLIQHLGIDVQMVVLAAEDHQRFTQELTERGIDTVEIAARRDVSASMFSILRTAIKNHAPDIVHTHLIHADLYGQWAARLEHVAGVSSFHSSNPFYTRFPIRTLIRGAYVRTQRVVAISDHVARFIDGLGVIDSSRVRTVPYGIDTSDWQYMEVDRVRARERFEMKGAVVGVASRLFPRKGHEVLIRAFAEVAEDVACALYIAGDGPLRAELERLAVETLPPDAYRFLGYVEDIRDFMNACDVMVFPTDRGFGEGFGLAALEAMAAGRPVIASAVDSLPEVVADAVSGLLVEPGDPHALAQALRRLLDDEILRHEMGLQAKHRAETCFSVDRMAESIVRIYQEVV